MVNTLSIEPLAKNATERDFCSLFIHNRRGSCKNNQSLLEFLIPYLPINQYKIRSWLRPDGLLLLLKTEEMARRVKADLDMRDPEFDVDFWAVRQREKDEKPGMKADVEDEELNDESEEEEGEKKMQFKREEKYEDDNSFATLQDEE